VSNTAYARSVKRKLEHCDYLLHACREAYHVVDGLYKLGVPTPQATPLLLAIMSHLTDGLDIRPIKPALHANIVSTPPSQLIKLAMALRVSSQVAPCSSYRHFTGIPASRVHVFIHPV
jgi:hypothetical protein